MPLCTARCDMEVSLDDGGRIIEVRRDPEHALTTGYAYFAGLQSPVAHNSPHRLLHPLKRMADGSFEHIAPEQALGV